MRYKRNKHKNKLFVLTLSLVAAILLYLTVSNLPDKPHTVTIMDDTEYKTFTYVITDIQGNEIYGKSTTDDTGIFFTRNDLEGIEVNDTVKVWFEPENLVEMVKIEKAN